MKLPRDISGGKLAESLSMFGYKTTRHSGSHDRLATAEMGERHTTIPVHLTLRVGKLNAVIRDVTEHFGLSRDEVADRLFQDKQ